MKKIISFTIEQDLISWLDTFSKGNPKYRNKSHFVEIALQRLKEEEESKTQTSSNNRRATQSTRKKSTTHAPATSTIHRRNPLLKSKE